ncbi:hypothetical protein NDU88_004041 [Pleurodeles waltl]|uniref:Uncharacterized protein n=1 Tax=Pleurodeles waltl TaxID=8319 RepID=A0AAV7TRG1_PLEWA|nr:hypothetical protein NDU88_004041 [Pleurodeles waltl]
MRCLSGGVCNWVCHPHAWPGSSHEKHTLPPRASVGLSRSPEAQALSPRRRRPSLPGTQVSGVDSSARVRASPGVQASRSAPPAAPTRQRHLAFSSSSAQAWPPLGVYVRPLILAPSSAPAPVPLGAPPPLSPTCAKNRGRSPRSHHPSSQRCSRFSSVSVPRLKESIRSYTTNPKSVCQSLGHLGVLQGLPHSKPFAE